MRRHHRESKVQQAEREVSAKVAEIVEYYDLTLGEETRILSGLLSNTAKWMIREERHPNDPAAPGGVEG